MKASHKNIVKVLKKFADYLEDMEPENRDLYVDSVNEMLDDILNDDGFGTEGQSDPRGDHRD